jgi:peptidoglycan/xylan/chitin deacetylase (PgdA/CDA1 family)
MEMPATFFIIAGWVGERHAFSESRHLRWEHIKRIENVKDRKGRQLFDIGSHSMWHTTLDKKTSENDGQYGKRLEEEIVEATRLIRERTGCPVRSYASPEGRGNPQVLERLFISVGLEAVRWASYPGRKNHFLQDLLELDISYCDTYNQAFDQLSIVLSNKWVSFFKRARRRLIAELRQRVM